MRLFVMSLLFCPAAWAFVPPGILRRHSGSTTFLFLSSEGGAKQEKKPLTSKDILARARKDAGMPVDQDEPDAPKLFDDALYEDMRQSLLTLEKRVKEGPGSLNVQEVQEFESATQRILKEMKDTLAGGGAASSPAPRPAPPATAPAPSTMPASDPAPATPLTMSAPAPAAPAGGGTTQAPPPAPADTAPAPFTMSAPAPAPATPSATPFTMTAPPPVQGPPPAGYGPPQEMGPPPPRYEPSAGYAPPRGMGPPPPGYAPPQGMGPPPPGYGQGQPQGYEEGGGFGLARGTANTYIIPGMDSMSPEEYRKALQQSVSDRQSRRREDRSGVVGNRAALQYLDQLGWGGAASNWETPDTKKPTETKDEEDIDWDATRF